jgi:predicted transcriptional regulator of viral defense system
LFNLRHTFLNLTVCVIKGDNIPHKRTEQKVKTADFFASWPVFSLDEAVRNLAAAGGRRGTIERLKHHLETGKIKLVTRGIYALVPGATIRERFHADTLLIAAALRPDGIFSHHGALELLGAAHSVGNRYTLYTNRRRRTLNLNNASIRFLEHPGPLQTNEDRSLGTRMVERRGRLLPVTGPERTLVEGFRRPNLVGGLVELVHSAAGFPVLELGLVEELLSRYNIANLWAATGWFLERYQQGFYVPEALLNRLEKRRPHSPQYLERTSRGGKLVPRWSLILPRTILQMGETSEP